MKNNLLLFSEFIEQNPDIYDNILIDDATKGAIYNWFMYRYISDNEKFKVFFRRSLNLYLNQYNRLLDLETTDIDWFVTNYLERLNINESTGNRNLTLEGSSDLTLTGTSKSTRTPLLNREETYNDKKLSTGTIENSGNNTGSSDTTNTGTITTENQGSSIIDSTSTESSDNKNLSSQLPNSITYPEAYDFPNLVWETATQQDESKTSSNVIGKNTTTDNSTNTQTNNTNTNTKSTVETTNTQTNDLTDSTTGTRSTKETGTDVTDINNNNTNTSKNNSTQTEESKNKGTNKEISTGRTENSAEILSKARDIIFNLNAFIFLRDKLEVCFYSLYDL